MSLLKSFYSCEIASSSPIGIIITNILIDESLTSNRSIKFRPAYLTRCITITLTSCIEFHICTERIVGPINLSLIIFGYSC
jgi:hypothetical protein